jgi:hypothetical protein
MAIPPEQRPSPGRVLLGFVAAAFASVTAVVLVLAAISGGGITVGAVFGFGFFAFLFGIPIALVAILILALPVYLLMRRHWHVRWWNGALTGFLVGTVAGLLVSGVDLAGAATFGLAGLVGGLAFWAIVRERPHFARVDPETFR